MKREQLLQEQIEAILEILESESTIPENERKAIEQISEIGNGREIAERKRNNEPMPDWVDNRSSETGPPE